MTKKKKEGEIPIVVGAISTQRYKEMGMKSSTPKCPHPNLQPLEIKFGQHVGKKARFDNDICIWGTTIMSSHRIRVVRYWCPTCNEIIEAPPAKVVQDKKED